MSGFDPAFVAMLSADGRFIVIVTGIVLMPQLLAGLVWSFVLRPRLALPAAALALLAAQGLTVTMTDWWGWFGRATGVGRTALCIPIWMLASLVLLNLMARVATAAAPPVFVGKDEIVPAPFGLMGLFDWVFRQAENVRNERYEPPASSPIPPSGSA